MISGEENVGLLNESNEPAVLDSMGVSENPVAQEVAAEEADHSGSSGETLAVQKRLKSLKRTHERELRELRAQINDLQAAGYQQPQLSMDMGSDVSQADSMQKHIHEAVNYALQQKEREEQKARSLKEQEQIRQHYGDFQKHLDSMADKYDDFHDVVLADHVPFTNVMRDYALTLPRSGKGSAGEVLYKLAKNPDELKRISNLHPIEQASELAKLAHVLVSESEKRPAMAANSLGEIKTAPRAPSTVSDKTPVSAIRKSMQSGTWR